MEHMSKISIVFFFNLEMSVIGYLYTYVVLCNKSFNISS